MQQKLIQFFYNKKLELLEITRKLPQSNASGSFLQTCINFVEQTLKFSHFEGIIIP